MDFYIESEMKHESLASLFLEATYILPQEIMVKRFKNGPQDRFYYAVINGKPSKPVGGVTTIISKTIAKDAHLFSWAVDKFVNIEAYHNFMAEKAAFGTFFHMLCADFLLLGKIDLNTIEDSVLAAIQENNLKGIAKPNEWILKTKKGLLSFAQFLIDYEVEPIAIEMVLCGKEYGGAIDLVAKIRPTPKATEKIIAIIDIKSGAISSSHAIQLQAYKELWESFYPNFKIGGIYNWSPNDFRLEGKKATYTLKNQSENKDCLKWKHALAIWLETEFELKDIVTINGELSLSSKDLTDFIKVETVNNALSEINKIEIKEDQQNLFGGL